MTDFKTALKINVVREPRSPWLKHFKIIRSGPIWGVAALPSHREDACLWPSSAFRLIILGCTKQFQDVTTNWNVMSKTVAHRTLFNAKWFLKLKYFTDKPSRKIDKKPTPIHFSKEGCYHPTIEGDFRGKMSQLLMSKINERRDM